MQTGKDFEVQYADVLGKCIRLIEEEAMHEREQIVLAIKLGEEVDVLIKHVEDKEAVFTRLSRDIFRVRGKSVSPSRISGYRQLYLNFRSIDTVTTIDNSMMNDVTVPMLTEIALRDRQQRSKPKEIASTQLLMLRKASRLLNRFEADIENKLPDNTELIEIFGELETIAIKAKTMAYSIQNAGGRSQLDLFEKYVLPAGDYASANCQRSSYH